MPCLQDTPIGADKLSSCSQALQEQPATTSLNQLQHYTRHPHYPDIILKSSQRPTMTASTFSQSNQGDNYCCAGALSICDSSEHADNESVPSEVV